MSGRKKVPPPVPVIGAGPAGGDGSREEQLKEWEESQRRLREQQAAAAAAAAGQPVLAAVPAPAAPAALESPVEDGPAAPEEDAAAEAAPAVKVREVRGFLEMPEFTEPDTADPVERLEFYSRGIFAVQYAANANHERAEQQRLIGLGLRLRAIKDEELHKSAGFDTFGDLTFARYNIRKHQANNIIRVLGVAQALEDMTTQELKERPLRVLVPILDTHGADAVRETWQEAARRGNVTDTALKEAANFLGYAPPKVLPVLEEAPKDKPKVPAVRVSDESERLVTRLRELAERDLEQARREAEALKSAVEELVEELAGNLER